MYAETSDGGTEAPYLYLGGTRVDSSGLLAVPSLVVDAASPSISDEIVFVYTVEFGDTITSTSTWLEVEGTSALHDEDAPLVDLLGRGVGVTLPVVGSNGSLSAASSLSINATKPVVVEVGSSLDGGEYGVGQVRLLPSLAAERTWKCRFSTLD